MQQKPTLYKSSARALSCSLVMSLAVLTAPTLQAAELSGNISLVSDYLFRGISQTNEGMALQGGLTLSNETGFYLSAWGSNISFGQGSMELDVLAGWTGALNEAWSTDIGIMQYRYPNGDNNTDQFNFFEVYSKFMYQGLTLGLAYSNDYFGTDVDAYYYLSAGYNYELAENWSLQLFAGLNQFDNSAEYNTFLAASPVSGDSYIDWSLGVTTNWLGSQVALKYADTNIAASANCQLCDGRLVFSVTKAF